MNSSNIIPQFFYDLIARIFPGSIIIACTMLVFNEPVKLLQWSGMFIGKKDEIVLVSFTFFLLYGALSYMIAIILNGFWRILVKVHNSFFSNTDSSWEAAIKKSKEDLINTSKQLGLNGRHQEDETFPSLPFVYDYIRLRAQGIGARFVKIRAEIHMCIILLMGFIAMLLSNFIYIIYNIFLYKLCWYNILFEFILIFMCFGIWFSKIELEKHFYTGLCNHWFLLQSSFINEKSSPQNDIKNTKTLI
jgi:hypothetical protein